MGLGHRGIYVIEARLTRVDGRDFSALTRPKNGQSWRWSGGEAVRLDGPPSTLLLGDAIGAGDMHRRVSRIVRRKFDLGSAQAGLKGAPQTTSADFEGDEPGFVISDGGMQFRIVPIQSETSTTIVFWCPDGVPLKDHDYKIVQTRAQENTFRQTNDFGGDVICFTKGTRIRVENGERLVEELSVGDKVQTKDSGAQEILWIGERRMSGARLYAMPSLRPIRVRASAIGTDVPDTDLLVSPHHRMLIEGPEALALFNQPEVLVLASDLIDDSKVFVDHAVKEVTYIHLLLADHSILWANGLMTESYHPANTTLKTVEADQRSKLLDIFPDIKRDPHSYGPFARRNLDKSEAAILRHVQVA